MTERRIMLPEQTGVGSAVWGAAVISLTLASGTAMRIVFSPVQEMVRLDLGLSDYQIGLVQGLAATIPIALMSIPIGWLVDRVNRVRLCIILSIVWTLGSALTSMATGFGALFAARMLCGFGVPAGAAAGSLIADLSVPERRGRTSMIVSLGVSVGASSSFAIGGWLSGWLAAGQCSWFAPANIHPWRTVHMVFALASAIFILPLLWVREPVRRERSEGLSPDLAAVFRAVWAYRWFLGPLFVGEVSTLMADNAALIWASPVLTRNYGLQPAQFGGWMALVILFPGILGTVAGGYLTDSGQKLKARGGVLAGAVLASVLSIAASFFPVMPGALGFAAMLSLLLVCGSITALSTGVAIAVLIPNEIRGVCLATIFSLSSILTLGVGPTLVTILSAAFGGDAHLGRALALVGASVCAVSVLAFMIAMRRAPLRDGVPVASGVSHES